MGSDTSRVPDEVRPLSVEAGRHAGRGIVKAQSGAGILCKGGGRHLWGQTRLGCQTKSDPLSVEAEAALMGSDALKMPDEVGLLSVRGSTQVGVPWVDEKGSSG